MPTYQYECEACSHIFEALQSITAKKLKKCPACGKNRLYRLIGTGVGIIFKGSGFYSTDYKKKEPSRETTTSTDSPKKKEDNVTSCCPCKASGKVEAGAACAADY